MDAPCENVRISVLTPSWNRAEFLRRVWEGLNRQSCRSFEWIVANDGSTDSTIQVVNELAAKSSFPVTLINASVRIGKSCVDNLLIRKACGEFVIWCDSDDELHADALESMLGAWDSLSSEVQDDYMGVTARVETDAGVLGNHIDKAQEISSWNDLRTAINSDVTVMARADLLKVTPFVEIDYLIPETSVWYIIGIRKSLFLDRPLAKVYYKQPFALSFTGKMQYNRGRAYALAGDHKFISKHLGLEGEFVRAVNYIRYCYHGDVGFREALGNWTGSNISHLMLILGVIPAAALIARDLFRGVVEKTHIPFASAKQQVTLDYTKFDSPAE